MSHLAVILLLASVTTAVVGSGIGSEVSASIGAAICQVSGGDCAPSPAGRAGRLDQPASPAAGTGGKGKSSEPVIGGGTNTPAPTSSVPGLPAEVVALLNLSDEGRKVIADAVASGIKVTLIPSHMYSYSNPSSGVYEIRADYPPEEMALLLHEMVNGKRIWDKNLDFRGESEKTYLKTMLDLSWDELAERYVIARGMSSAGHPIFSNSSDFLVFNNAYDRAVRGENEARMRANRPLLSPAEAEAVGKKAGRDVLAADEASIYGFSSHYKEMWRNCKSNRSSCRPEEAWG